MSHSPTSVMSIHDCNEQQHLVASMSPWDFLCYCSVDLHTCHNLPLFHPSTQFIIIMAGGTALQTPFIFSYMRRGKAAKGETVGGVAAAEAVAETVQHPYENSIKTITQVETVEGFWETYDFLKRPNDLPTTTDYHFFRGGDTPIKPTWEDVS